MLTRREIALIVFYGAVFSAVVWWASTRTEPQVESERFRRRGTTPDDLQDDDAGRPEFRHVIRR